MNKSRWKLLSNHEFIIQSQFIIMKSYFTLFIFIPTEFIEGHFGLIPAVLNSKMSLFQSVDFTT